MPSVKFQTKQEALLFSCPYILMQRLIQQLIRIERMLSGGMATSIYLRFFLAGEDTCIVSVAGNLGLLASGQKQIVDNIDNINQSAFLARAGQGCEEYHSELEPARVLLKQPVTSRHSSLSWGRSSLSRATVVCRVCCSFCSLSSLPLSFSESHSQWLFPRCLIMLTFPWRKKMSRRQPRNHIKMGWREGPPPWEFALKRLSGA